MSHWAKHLGANKYQLCIKSTENKQRFEKRKIIEAKNQREANSLAKEFEKEIIAGKVVHVTNAEREITVAKCCEDFSNFLVLKKRADSTVARFRTYSAPRIIQAVGNVPVASASEKDVETLATSLSDLSPGVANACLHYFRAVIQRAIKKGYRKTPAPTVSDYLCRVPETEITIWNESQKQKALATAKAISLYHEAIITLGLFCGLRAGEIGALKKEDCDLTKTQEYPFGKLSIRRTFAIDSLAKDKTQPPKGKKTRAIPLTPATRNLIQRLILAASTDWLMPQRRDKSKCMGTQMIAHYFATVCFNVSGDRSRHTHVMRHTFCSDLYRATKNPYLVMGIAGHADLKQTQKYVHLNDREKALGVLALDPADADSRLELIERQVIDLCGGDMSAAQNLLNQVSQRLMIA